MLGFRLLRCNVIRLKSCALTSPVSTASLLTSCCRRYIHCTPSTSVQSYSSKQFNKFGDRNKKSQMQVKQRKRKYKRPPKKSSSRKNLYMELIKSGIERFQTLQRTDISEMDLHKIIEWLELSEVPTVNTALYDHVLKLLYSKSFHPNQYTQKELAMLLSLGGVEYNIAAVPPTLQQRKEYVSEFLEVLKEKGAKLGIDLWNTKYVADFENGLKIDVLQILEDLSQKNLEPNIQTYELITKIYASKGKFYEITEVIEHMKDLKILVTPKILENFVYASTLVGGLEAIKGNLKKFLSSNELGPLDQSRLYLAMARAYSKQGELEDIIKLISARASLIHSIKEKPRESREKKAVDEVDNAKLLEICYNLMNRQEKDVIKAIKPFMKKFDNGYYFYIYRKQIDMKAVEYYEKKRDFETSIQLLSLIGTYPPGLFMIAGLISKDLTNNKINIDDIIKYSEILKENMDYKWPLAFFINEFHKYRLDQPLDKQKRSNQKFIRLMRTFFASDEYKEISQTGNRRILEEIHMWLQERSSKTKNADQNKLLDTIDAYTPLEEIALSQTRRRFITLPKRRVEIFSPENTVPPEPEVILNKLPELLALKALKEKLKETTSLAQKHEEKQNTPVVLKNETTSDMLTKLGTEKAINEKSKRQMSQISKKQFKEKSAQKVQEKGVLFENPAIYDNIRTQEKSARALNHKQPNTHPQNLDHKNEAQQQEMSQKSTEEDSTELKLLVQEANRLKAMYREDPKSVDPLSIAQIYAFILEERAKKQPPFPFAIYLGIKDFFSLNLDQHQRDSIKTDFPKWMEIAVENAVKNEQYGLMERLMKIRSKHGVQVSPKTMLLYAQNVQKRVPEEQEKIALVEKEKIILEEKVSLQKQVKRVQQIAQAPKSKTLKSRGVLVRKYAKKSLKSPTTPQKVPISKKFIVEEPDFSEPSADESIEKLAQIEESKGNVQEQVPKRRPSATKSNVQEVKLKQKLESITQTPILQEIHVSQQKPVSELPRKVLIDKLSDTPIEKVQEKSSLENFIEDLSKNKIFSGYKKEKEAQEEKQKLVSHWPPPQEEVDKSARLRKEKEEIYKLIENAQLDKAFAKIQPYVKESKNYHITMDLLSAAIKHDNTQLLSQLQTEYRTYPIANSSTFQISMAIALLENGKPSEANLILENKKLIFSRGIMAALTSREVHLNRPDVLHKMFLRFYKSEGTSPTMMLTMIHPIIRLYDTKQDLDGLISLKSDLQRLDCPIHTDVDLLFNMTIDRLKSKNNTAKEDPPNEPKELPETQNFQQDISTEPIFSRIQEKLKSQGQSNMSPNFDLNLNPKFYPYKILPPGVMENSYREARRPFSLMFQMSKDGKDEQF